MKRAFGFLLGLAISGLLLTACNKDTPTGADPNVDDPNAIGLEKEFGGFTTSDEAPMFNDAEVMSEALEDVSINDQLSADDLRAFNANNGMKGYVVRITWGLLQGDSTATEVVDWSGNASVDRGVLAVLRTINFEPNSGDALVLPRNSRQELAFASHTRPYLDGLLLLIINKDTSDTEGELRLNLGGYSRTLRFSELEAANIVEPVGANGHAVSIVSRSREAQHFEGGFLVGRWVRKNEQGGEFYGRWINSEGSNTGAVRGIWGQRRSGEKVFFGKYIDTNGEFRGLLRGTWLFNDARSGGLFEGRWYDRTLQEHGALKGHFRLGRPNDGRGYFHGRWERVN